MKATKYVLAAALLAGSVAAHAVTIFSDNFDNETPGLNRTPSNFALLSGSVDIIGSGPNGSSNDVLPGNGYYIDLDGSTGQGGTLQIEFTLQPGTTYVASFDLAGSQRGDSNAVTVDFGSQSAMYTLASGDPFKTFQLSFTPAANANPQISYALRFSDGGNDSVGALLDNVSVTTAVPEPASVALMLSGLGVVGWAGRRRNRRA